MAGVHYCPVCLTTFREAPPFCPNLACGKQEPGAGWGRLLGEGDLLDRHYQIVRALAVGGAGLTYLAREVDADGQPQPPDLAIKVLYHARATGTFLTRLSTEAQILQELDHDNIIQSRGFVHRAGTEPYLVTLYEEGGTLTHHIDTHGPLPVRVSAAILCQILDALNVAHQRGVVHRDLKPDNVLLTQHVGANDVPHIRVADFGIAKVSGALTSHVTKMGTFIGTPEYAAPEQFEGTQPTPAADVFAAGALFLHMLTGSVPVAFSDRNDVAGCHAEWMAALPPTLDRARLVDTDPVTATVVEEVARHMLADRPEKRWTVQQVLRRLKGVAQGDVELQPSRDTLELTASPSPRRKDAPDAPLTTSSDDGGGWGATLAGVGVLGAGALIASSLVGLLVLLFAAWQWGYFSPDRAVVVLGPTDPPSVEPVPIEPVPLAVPVEPQPTEQPSGHPPEVLPSEPVPTEEPLAIPTEVGALSTLAVVSADSPERLALQEQIQALDTLKACGEGVLLATVWIVDGAVTQVETDEPAATLCLRDRILGLPGPDGVSRIAILR